MVGRGRGTIAAVGLIALAMAACGGAGSSGTGATADGPTGTTAAEVSPTPTPREPTAEASPSPTGALTEESRACIDAFVRFLVDVEDLVAGFDFDGATLEDYSSLSMSLVPAGEAFAGRVEGMRCTDRDGTPSDELTDALIDVAGTEAPGSVDYLELLIAVSELRTTEPCTEDIDALQTYVEAGGTVGDLTTVERWHAFDLATSINAWCSLQTAGEYLSRDEVTRFLEID